MPLLTGLINPVRLASLVQRYVGGGLKPDSLRRALNRERISTAGLNLGAKVASARIEYDNSLLIRRSSGNLLPRPGRDMVGVPFKVPARYKYAVDISYMDPETKEIFKQIRTVYSQDPLTKAEAQRLGMSQARQGLQSPRGKSDPSAPFRVVEADLVNAYYNLATEV